MFSFLIWGLSCPNFPLIFFQFTSFFQASLSLILPDVYIFASPLKCKDLWLSHITVTHWPTWPRIVNSLLSTVYLLKKILSTPTVEFFHYLKNWNKRLVKDIFLLASIRSLFIEEHKLPTLKKNIWEKRKPCLKLASSKLLIIGKRPY